MINREDMMELTRRMTPARTSFTRIAGCYVDSDGEFDGSFNVNFLKLAEGEKKKNLAIAKAIPFSDTNVELKKYEFGENSKKPGSMRQMLMGIRECGLKNDELMDTFYDILMEYYPKKGKYAIFVFHDIYDVPVKAADKVRLGESEEVFAYIICAVCPLLGEYEPGKPEWGFLFPAFTDRSGDLDHVDVFQKDAKKPEGALLEMVLGGSWEKRSAKMQTDLR